MHRTLMRTRMFSPRIWMKLAVIAVSFIIPLVVTTYFLVDEQNIALDFTRQELRGDRYLRPLSRLLTHVELHRLAIRPEETARAAQLEARVDADFRTLLAVDQELRDVAADDRRGADCTGPRLGAAVPPASLVGARESGRHRRSE